MNLFKKVSISTETAYHLKNKKILNEIVEKRSSDIKKLEKIVNSDNQIYKYKTEGRSPKDLRNYQHPVQLLKSLKDGKVNPREVLKAKLTLNQIQAK